MGSTICTSSINREAKCKVHALKHSQDLPLFIKLVTMSLTLNLLGLFKWPVAASTTPVLSACFATFQAVIFMVMLILITKRLSSPQKPNQGKGSNKQAPLPPGPIPWPVIGSVPDMRRNKPAFRWIHRFMKENNTNIACFRLGNTHVIPVTCPKIAREFLKNQDTIFQSRSLLSFASYTFSRGFLSAAFAPYGDQWKKMRRVLTTEIICTARQQWMHDKRAEEADNLVKYVYNQSTNSDNVDLRIVTRCYTGNVIRKLLFGKRYFGEPMPDGSPGVDEIDHVEALFTSLIYVNAFCISDFLPWLLGLDLDGHEKIVKEAKQTIDKYHDPVIDERIKQWRDGNSNGKEVEDFLDVLITLKDTNGQPLLTTEEIKAQCWELMVAAVDNPANAVEWILGEMVNQPEILQKAVEEIDSVVGKDRLVQESDIPKLNYTKACIREAFRLHPVAPFNVPHVALTDTTVAGYFIPKGSHVILSRYGLGRNPDVWDEPTKFKPERHLKECLEVALTEHDLRFISFSTGRRGCIAASLGTLMTTMLLARLVQGFTWNAPGKASHVDLSEAEAELFLAKPLKLRAVRRLPQHLYPTAN